MSQCLSTYFRGIIECSSEMSLEISTGERFSTGGNELVICMKPYEATKFKINSKIP